jgi:hypothetical protein
VSFAWLVLRLSWIALTTDLVLAAFVLGRRLWRKVPAFSIYLLFGPVSNLSMWYASTQGPRVHFAAHYTVDTLYKLLNLWVTLEIYARLMTAFPALRQLAARVLWMALSILLIICVIVYELSDLQGIPTTLVVFNSLARSFRIVQLGLFIIVFLIARSFHLRLGRYYTFIAIGLVLIDCSELVALSVFAISRYSIPFLHAGILLRIGTDLLVALMWIYVLYAGEGPRSTFASPSEAALAVGDVDQWNAALSDARERSSV